MTTATATADRNATAAAYKAQALVCGGKTLDPLPLPSWPHKLTAAAAAGRWPLAATQPQPLPLPLAATQPQPLPLTRAMVAQRLTAAAAAAAAAGKAGLCESWPQFAPQAELASKADPQPLPLASWPLAIPNWQADPVTRLESWQAGKCAESWQPLQRPAATVAAGKCDDSATATATAGILATLELAQAGRFHVLRQANRYSGNLAATLANMQDTIDTCHKALAGNVVESWQDLRQRLPGYTQHAVSVARWDIVHFRQGWPRKADSARDPLTFDQLRVKAQSVTDETARRNAEIVTACRALWQGTQGKDDVTPNRSGMSATVAAAVGGKAGCKLTAAQAAKAARLPVTGSAVRRQLRRNNRNETKRYNRNPQQYDTQESVTRLLAFLRDKQG